MAYHILFPLIWIKRKKWLEKDKFNCIYRAFIVLDYQFLTYLTKVASKFANPVSVRFHITYTHSPDLLYTFFALRASSPSCTTSVWAKFWFRRSLYPSHWRQLLCSAGGLGGQSHSSVFFQLPLSFPLEDPTKLTIPLSLFTWRKSSKTALSNLLLDTGARRKGHLEFSFQWGKTCLLLSIERSLR